jgi:hypothetical protein
MNLFMHSCGGKLSKLSLLESDANCGMENSLMKSRTYCKSSIENDDTCCQNHSVKSPHQVQIIEKANFQLTNITTIVYPQFSILQNLIDYNFKLTDVISPHPKQFTYIKLKLGIYSLLQNFRN